MSRFQAARANFREKLFGQAPAGESTEPSSTPTISSTDSAEDEEISRREKKLRQLLVHARRKYIEHGIEGSIDISSSVTVFTYSISCDVSNDPSAEVMAESIAEESTPEEQAELSRTNSAIISSMDGVISKLEKRALAYRNTNFRDDITLSSGIYVTMPFLGLTSTSITFTASVKSLLNRLSH